MHRCTRLVVLCMVLACCAHRAAGQTGLSRLISDANLNDYLAKYLNISEAQAAYIERLHASYKETWATEFNAETIQLNSKWNATYTHFENFTGASMAEAYRDVLVLVEKMRARRKVANDLFLDSIEVILSEEQRPSMQRVRNAHHRLSFHDPSRSGLREREIDVIALVEEMPLSPEERGALEPVLRDFELSYVSQMRDAVDFNLRREQLIFGALEMARRSSLHPNNADGGEEARLREADRLGSEASRIGFASQKRLVEANRRGLRLFVAVITPESAEELLHRYDQQAYPEVTPDPVFAIELYDQAMAALGGKDPDRLTALEAWKEEYVREHHRLSRKMIEAAYAMESWPFELAIKHRDSDFGPQYREEIARTRKKNEERLRTPGIEREKLNLRQPARIRELLLPEEVALLPVWRFEKSVAPRPWGRLANAQTRDIERATMRYKEERHRELNGIPSSQPAATQPSATQPQPAASPQ